MIYLLKEGNKALICTFTNMFNQSICNNRETNWVTFPIIVYKEFHCWTSKILCSHTDNYN